MIVYNTTFHVENEVLTQWLDYIKDVYVPEAMKSGILIEPMLAEVFGHEQQEGHSFALQFKAADLDQLEAWYAEGKKLHDELARLFGNKVAGFSTLLEEISLDK